MPACKIEHRLTKVDNDSRLRHDARTMALVMMINYSITIIYEYILCHTRSIYTAQPKVQRA
jgi:hypothetical protein